MYASIISIYDLVQDTSGIANALKLPQHCV